MISFHPIRLSRLVKVIKLIQSKPMNTLSLVGLEAEVWFSILIPLRKVMICQMLRSKTKNWQSGFSDDDAGKPLLPIDGKEEVENEKAKPVTYSYAFFHLIFSLASMYSAMLLTGWSTSVGESGKLVDVGWPSVWVRIVTGWATAALYIWSLAAPILFPDREF